MGTAKIPQGGWITYETYFTSTASTNFKQFLGQNGSVTDNISHTSAHEKSWRSRHILSFMPPGFDFYPLLK